MKQATLLGLAIGDALGQPFEFSSADMIINSGWNGDMAGSSFGFKGMWNLNPGQWTDDTKMALCITNSLLSKKEFDVSDVADAMQYPYEYDHVVRLNQEAIELAASDVNFIEGTTLGVNGTAHETLASALFCFLRFRSFNDSVAACVLLGGDTDSRAAIAGAMAGAAYGVDMIREDWISQVEDSEKLQKLDDDLYAFELDRLLSEMGS